MIFLSLLLANSGMTSALGSTASSLYAFKPDLSSKIINAEIPLTQNVSSFQTAYSSWPGTSWWLNACITTTCSPPKQFFIVSHAIFRAGGSGRLRSSILSLENPVEAGKYKNNLIVIERPGDGNVLDESTGRLKIDDNKRQKYVFEALSADNLKELRTMAKNDDWGFDVTWQTTSPIILNWGGNEFNFGSGKTIEWSFPANRILTGTIEMDGKVMEIDVERSSAWYDRQVNDGYPDGGWTWFALHFPGSEIKLTVFHYRKDGRKFASVRMKHGTMLLDIETIDFDTSKDWRSEFSGLIYGQAWKVKFTNGDWLEICSVREDQEIRGSETVAALNIYEGFIEATGSFMGYKEAFGLVEQFHTS